MSIQGTGVAAGVAQTALQAQQVARQREKRDRDRDRSTFHGNQRVQDIYEAQLKVLEEHDEGEATPRLVVDDQMQEGRPPRDDAPNKARKRLDVTG